jgi:two-component system, cell cycle sensor histidine kinase and response regulator CckA
MRRDTSPDVSTPAKSVLTNVELAEIIDTTMVQSLMDDFYELAHIPMAIVDMKGRILVGVGWQEICTGFHRVHPETCKNCVESDTQLSAGISPGNYKLYKCKNNMWDVATPLIVDNQQLGSVFSGQFFFDDEPMDYDLFRAQAKKYGFDEEKYIGALEAVPRLSRETLTRGMAFLTKLAHMISQMGYGNLNLKHNHHTSRAIVHGSPIPQFVLAQDHTVISWNRALEAHTGISAESVIGTNQHWRAFYPSARPCLADLIIDENLESIRHWYSGKYEKSEHVEGAYEATDFFPAMGEHGKWLYFTAAALRDLDGAIIGAVETLEDITERKIAEEEAHAARQQLLDIIEFLPDATFVVDQQKRVIAWNRAIEEMTGVPKGEIIGKSDHAYGVPFYGERRPLLVDLIDMPNSLLQARYDNFCRKGNTLYAEGFYPALFAGKGAYIWALATPLLDSKGNRVGTIESIRDLTEHKQAAEDLLRMQDQLRQAAKMEAIGSLAGGIAHDFNNQLTIVQGYCKLLLDSLPREETGRESVREILKAAERSAKLTNQLLAFGRKQRLKPEILDLREVLSGLMDPLRRMIGENIQVELHVSEDLCPVEVDRNQLEQALINLAINSRDAMPGGGRLTIEATNVFLDTEHVLRHAGAAEGPHVHLSFSDTGTGMDEGTLQRIFEPFFTTKPLGEGTGLGLATVYGFIKQSSGHLEVRSQSGQGACFNLYFPQAAGDRAVQLSVPETPVPKGSETILVIEDEDALRELTAHILKSSGYKVLKAADGRSAITLNRQYASPIELIVSDVIMPGLPGPDVIKQLIADRPGLKVLYVTGYAERAALGEDATASRTKVLSKPFLPETLLRVIRQVLDENIEMCA